MVFDYVLPNFKLQSGAALNDLRLRYEVHGTLSAEKDNAVLFPTCFGGRTTANVLIVGPGRRIDTDRYCVIVVDAFGNGESSSPSNHSVLANGGNPLCITILDNVTAQRSLLSSLGIERPHAVIGRSMGAQQALQWGCWYPEAVERVFAFCGTPATTAHNRVLLNSVAAPLEAFARGELSATQALKQAAATYAAWSMTDEFFNDRYWLEGTAAEWIKRNITATFFNFHPLDLLSLLRTWHCADIAANARFGGDLAAALHAISASVLLMPISHDLIFPPQEFEYASEHIRRASTSVLYSHWGHQAGAPGSDCEDIAEITRQLARFLLARPLSAWDCFAEVGCWPI
ncbi:MAG: alpha/beta fold hydrolase [Pseudomonadota bacterium]